MIRISATPVTSITLPSLDGDGRAFLTIFAALPAKMEPIALPAPTECLPQTRVGGSRGKSWVPFSPRQERDAAGDPLPTTPGDRRPQNLTRTSGGLPGEPPAIPAQRRRSKRGLTSGLAALGTILQARNHDIEPLAAVLSVLRGDAAERVVRALCDGMTVPPLSAAMPGLVLSPAKGATVSLAEVDPLTAIRMHDHSLARAGQCVCGCCLRECLGGFIPKVTGYLIRNGVDEDLAIEATTLVYRKAVRWIYQGKAAGLTSAHRRGRLCRSGVNGVYEIERKRKRDRLARAVPILPGNEPPATPAECGPLQTEEDARIDAIEAANADIIKESLAQLCPEYRRLLTLRFCERMSLVATAKEMGWTTAQVRHHELPARDRLTDIFLRRRWGRRNVAG
jgi:hypothetical protein